MSISVHNQLCFAIAAWCVTTLYLAATAPSLLACKEGVHRVSWAEWNSKANKTACISHGHQYGLTCIGLLPDALYGLTVMASSKEAAVAVSLSLKTSTLAMSQLMSVGAWMMRSLVKLPYVVLAGASALYKQLK